MNWILIPLQTDETKHTWGQFNLLGVAEGMEVDLEENDLQDQTPGTHVELVTDNETSSLLNQPLGEVEVLLNCDLYDAEESPIDCKLEKIWYQDFERLTKAQTELSSKVKDPKLTVVLRSRIASMVGVTFSDFKTLRQRLSPKRPTSKITKT